MSAGKPISNNLSNQALPNALTEQAPERSKHQEIAISKNPSSEGSSSKSWFEGFQDKVLGFGELVSFKIPLQFAELAKQIDSPEFQLLQDEGFQDRLSMEGSLMELRALQGMLQAFREGRESFRAEDSEFLSAYHDYLTDQAKNYQGFLEKEKEEIWNDAKVIGRQKRWESKNVTIDHQKQIESRNINDLEEHIASGVMAGNKLEFAKMTLRRKMRDEHKFKEDNKHEEIKSIMEEANDIAEGANYVAATANAISTRANQKSNISIIIAIISAVAAVTSAVVAYFIYKS